MSTAPCILCQKPTTPWQEINDYTVAQCTACGTEFLDPMPTAHVLDEFYKNYLTHYPKHSAEDSATKKMQSYYEGVNRARLTKIMRAYGKDSDATTKPALLDLGCASGLFIKNARERGCIADGVEISQEEVQQARMHNPTSRIYDLPLAQNALADNSYDIVTAWDILEHIPDQDEFLTEIARILKPGGVFAASTINASALNKHLFGRYWGFYIPPEHVLFYSARGLQQYVERYNFTMHRYDTLYAPQLTLSSLLNRIRQTDTTQKGFNAPPHIAVLYLKKYLALPINLFVRHTSLGDIIEFYAVKRS